MKLGELIGKAKIKRCGADEYPVLSMTMHDGIVEQRNRFKKAIASKDTSSYKVVNPGQLVVGFPIDEGVIYVQKHPFPGIMSPAYNIWDIDTGKVDSSYLELALHGPRSMAYYADKMRGTTARRRSITADSLCALEIPLPSLSVQREVVALFRRVKKAEFDGALMKEKLDSLVKSRFVEMFGNLEENPFKWPICQFGSFASIDMHMTSDFDRYADMPHIGIDSIEKSTGKLSGYRTVAEDGVKSGKYPFDSRHIIYSKIRPALNKVATPDFEGLCSADAYPILPNAEVCERHFLAYVMRSNYFLDYVSPLSARAQMPKVNKKAIEGFSMPLPPIELQQEFADFVAQVDKSRFVARQSAGKYNDALAAIEGLITR